MAQAAGRQTGSGAAEKCMNSIFHSVVLFAVLFTTSSGTNLSWREKSTIGAKLDCVPGLLPESLPGEVLGAEKLETGK